MKKLTHRGMVGWKDLSRVIKSWVGTNGSLCWLVSAEDRWSCLEKSKEKLLWFQQCIKALSKHLWKLRIYFFFFFLILLRVDLQYSGYLRFSWTADNCRVKSHTWKSWNRNCIQPVQSTPWSREPPKSPLCNHKRRRDRLSVNNGVAKEISTILQW